MAWFESRLSDGGGGTEKLDALLDGSITSVESGVTTIRTYSFHSCTSLTTVSLPNITNAVNYAFYGCTSLPTISLPNATSIGNSAFSNCTSLATVSIPNATSVGESAFYGCTSLKNISLPLATSIGSQAFRNSGIETVDFPNVTTLGSNASFQSCGSLTTISLPKVTTIGGFYGCGKLESAIFDVGTSITAQAFQGCRSLSTLVLKSTTMCVINSLNAFSSSKFAFGGGTIYVPQDLISTYEADTNWSTVLAYGEGNQLLPIEGSIYE